MTGTVTPQDEAQLKIIVRGPAGQEQEVEATIDTGFTGYLTFPSAVIALLALTYHSQSIAILADGSKVMLAIYRAVVLWEGQPLPILVVQAEGGVLLGTRLLHGTRLVVEFVDGGPVTVTLLP